MDVISNKENCFEVILVKDYFEINFTCGDTIENAMNELYKKSEDGNRYGGTFNDTFLTSDMSIDEAYKKVLGMSYAQFCRYKITAQLTNCIHYYTEKIKSPDTSPNYFNYLNGVEDGLKKAIDIINKLEVR